MSLHILHSNRVEALLDDFAAKIALAPEGAGPLEAETVLLDNPSLSFWINLQLARKHSIAANIRYVRLSEFFWELSRVAVSSDIPRQTPLGKPEMTWRLMELLESGSLLGQAGLEPVRKYLGLDEPEDDFTDLKRYQLAGSIADLFDQYMVYRPQWINTCWDKGRNIAVPGNQGSSWAPSESWQKLLWEALQQQLPEGESHQHRAAIHRRLCRRLEHQNPDVQEHYRRIFIFGVTAMPPSDLDVLMGLASSIDVYLFLFNPCEMEWFDIRSARQISRLQKWDDMRLRAKDREIRFERDPRTGSLSAEPASGVTPIEIGNPLLAGQGGQVRDFINLVYSRMDQYLESARIEDGHAFERPDPERKLGLLSSIQQDILELNFRGDIEQYAEISGNPLDLPGGEGNGAPSIHIHNCHSPLREVEVLHDQLLDLFDRDPDLNPREVVVMMPRVAPYVPYIKSVFESAAPGQRIPYHITDRTLVEESPVLNSFETLLSLPDSRLPLSEILGLLELPAVSRKLNIDRDDYEILKTWLIESGARWGLDAAHREREVHAAYEEFSWSFGLNRMFAGYAMQSGDDYMPLGVLPLDEIEGGNTGIFDSFLRFWKALTAFRASLAISRPPGGWKTELTRLLETFYAPQEAESGAFRELRRGIDELGLVESEDWFSGKLTLQVVRAVIDPVLNQARERRHPWSEGVKFCSLLPMRGVPFKVIYLLGMNMDDYPRRLERKSFDLMRNDYRPGDRSARTDDRWLFLEALLSARQAFHVSYIGQDMHRNEPREPSVVLSELIDYLRDGYRTDAAFDKDGVLVDSFLFTRQALQPFNPVYFPAVSDHAPNRLFSFDPGAYSISRAQMESRKAGKSLEEADSRWFESQPEEDGIEVSLDEFAKFFARPWDWFFQARGISLNRRGEEVNDEELWGLQAGLGDWRMRERLLERVNSQGFDAAEGEDSDAARDKAISALITEQKAMAAWPLGSNGDKARARLEKLKPEYLALLAGKVPEQLHVKSEIPCRIEGPGGSRRVMLSISGAVPLFGEDIVFQSASKASEKFLVDFYIRLAAAMSGEEASTRIASAKIVFSDTAKPLAPAGFRPASDNLTLMFDRENLPGPPDNSDLLSRLGSLYISHRESGLPFHPGVSLGCFKSDSEEDLQAHLETGWYGNPFRPGISDQEKERAYFGSFEAFSSEYFVGASQLIWRSFYDWLGREVKNEPV